VKMKNFRLRDRVINNYYKFAKNYTNE